MSEPSIVPVEQTLSNKLLLIPLAGRPIFPGIFTPLMINSAEDTKSIEESNNADGLIGIVMLKNEVDNPTVSDLHSVGTVARIIKKINLPDGGVNVFISTIKRFKIRKVLNEKEPMCAIVDYLDDEEDIDTFEVKALTRALISEMKEISENNPLFSEEMRLNMVNIDNPGRIADFIASILNVDRDEQQRVLEILNVRQRMEKVLVFIKKEQELLRIQKKIQTEINEKIEKNQREYFLKEELKSIQDELGMITDAKTSDYQKFKEKIDKFNFIGEIKETVDSELDKFSLMDPNSGEFIVTRNYLETIASLPWLDAPAESYNIASAREILDSEHYGLDDVKKRIIEYLSVRILKKDSKGSIIILVGPPGVGKTSIGKSIAKSMNRPFFRFSVGGMRDESEIKGHRRTYIGAMPGKIIQGLKIVKSKSPVFLIDEVDKMGSSYQGDPSSALLEVLDPEQNVAFRDNYLDLPFDISNILFILTANTLDSIPLPLLDRAEIISLSGYIDGEKIEIAKKYLIPRTLEKCGLKKGQIKYSKEALLFIVESYAREAGVRNLEKYLEKINRKYATDLLASKEIVTIFKELDEEKKKNQLIFEDKLKLEKIKNDEIKLSEAEKISSGPTVTTSQSLLNLSVTYSDKVKNSKKDKAQEIKYIVSDKEKQLQVEYNKAISKTTVLDEKQVEQYLGKPIFDEDEIKKAEKPGSAIGLAWTSMGGDTLLLESVAIPGKEELKLTGQMGDVMKESAMIAMTLVKKYSIDNAIVEPSWFEKNAIHFHIPEGATPKDGPSAGITMATTFLSLIMNKPIKKNLAMTGELSLLGQVLPIGGLKEKTVAARRNKIKYIIIPKANLKDLAEIPDHVKKGITFYPVSMVEEVFKLVF